MQRATLTGQRMRNDCQLPVVKFDSAFVSLADAETQGVQGHLKLRTRAHEHGRRWFPLVQPSKLKTD